MSKKGKKSISLTKEIIIVYGLWTIFWYILPILLKNGFSIGFFITVYGLDTGFEVFGYFIKYSPAWVLVGFFVLKDIFCDIVFKENKYCKAVQYPFFEHLPCVFFLAFTSMSSDPTLRTVALLDFILDFVLDIKNLKNRAKKLKKMM